MKSPANFAGHWLLLKTLLSLIMFPDLASENKRVNAQPTFFLIYHIIIIIIIYLFIYLFICLFLMLGIIPIFCEELFSEIEVKRGQSKETEYQVSWKRALRKFVYRFYSTELD